MELVEPIETINQFLIDEFGIDTASTDPIFRVVWSEDQLEKQKTNTTPEGILLLYPIIREVPKYRQWIQHKYVLERLTVIPEFHKDQLVENKLSYEPIWVFEGKNGQYVPPTRWGCKFVVDCLYAALGKKSLAKYVDDEAKNPVEFKQKAVDKLMEELYGDESSLQLKTVTGEAVAYTGPQEYRINKQFIKLAEDEAVEQNIMNEETSKWHK